MSDEATLKKLLDDLRVDREELVVLRTFYEAAFKLAKKPPDTHQQLMEKLLDMLPKRREYLLLRHEWRGVELSPPVTGYKRTK